MDILGAGPCAGEGVWVSGMESRARETRPRGRVWGGNPRPQLGASIQRLALPSIHLVLPSPRGLGAARRRRVPRPPPIEQGR